jgi:hypothetical protein
MTRGMVRGKPGAARDVVPGHVPVDVQQDQHGGAYAQTLPRGVLIHGLEAPRQIKGFVPVDDAYLGGERNGGKPERG